MFISIENYTVDDDNIKKTEEEVVNICFCVWSFIAAHYDEIFYICLFFGIAVLILLSSIMVVFGRIILHKRNASAMNSSAVSVSELSTTVDAMTKLQSSDTIVVTTMTTDSDVVNTKASSPAIANANDECIDGTSDIDLTTPISIPSISSRNNVSFEKSLVFSLFSFFYRCCC